MADVTRLDGIQQPDRTQDPVAAPATRIDSASTGPSSGAPATRLDGGTTTTPFLRENLPPDLAARYTMGRELGRGGEATVWLCTDAEGSEVAIKLFQHPPTYRTDFGSAEYRARFQRDYAVQVFERGEDHGVFYEVMEYCGLGTLEDHLKRLGGTVSHSDAITILWQIASALHGMQGPGTDLRLVHGDINPKNILVRTGAPLDLVLTDFGLSVDLGGRSRLSNTGKGTLAYSAPGAMRHYTQADDWWSVGMTMYQVLLGRNYFQHSDSRWIADDRIENELTVRDVALGEIDEVPLTGEQRQQWKLLLAGLLTRDRDYRWSIGEIEKWCRGESPQVHRLIDVSQVPAAEIGAAGGRSGSRAVTPFALAGVGTFYGARELGEAMAADPRAAARAVSGRGRQVLVDWLTEEVQTGSGYPELRSYGDLWGPDETAVYFVAQLASEAGLTYQEHPITTPADLRRLAQSDAAADVVGRLFESHLLAGIDGDAPERSDYRMIDANWHDIVEQAIEAANRALDLAKSDLQRRRVPFRERTPVDEFRGGVSLVQQGHIIATALLIAASDDAVADRYVESVKTRIAGSVVAHQSTGWFATLRRDYEM